MLAPSFVYAQRDRPDTCYVSSQAAVAPFAETPMTPPQLSVASRNHQLLELVGPAITQAFQLARYQALRNINGDVVEIDENDVINQKPSREEERIMASNVSVVSALEDLFSWMSVASSFIDTFNLLSIATRTGHRERVNSRSSSHGAFIVRCIAFGRCLLCTGTEVVPKGNTRAPRL